MEFKVDKGTGYKYAYSPGHPCANKAGKVLEHVYVAYKNLGRSLQSEECVHHEDRNRENNSWDNLRVMTLAEHALLHAKEDRNYVPYYTFCSACGASFLSYRSENRSYCSKPCADKGSMRFEISPDELKELVWSMPTSSVATLLGVSDVAVSKRCKKLGISKPPRGYWMKQKAGV